MPEISVITPYYYGEKYISNLHQMINRNVGIIRKYKVAVSVEFIVVNDSPVVKVSETDVYSSYSYKLINHSQNKGIHGARISGLIEAAGDYILFLDQDDEISDDYLLQQYQKIGQKDVVIANAWIEQSNYTKQLLYKNKFQYKKILVLDTYAKSHNQIVSPGQCLIRKSAIPNEWVEYTTKNNGSDDLLLWVIMLSRKRKIVINKNPIYTHKYTGANLSENLSKMRISSLEVADYLENISDIDYKVIRDIKRSRKLGEVWSKSNLILRVKLICKNIDLYAIRLIWKIKSYI